MKITTLQKAAAQAIVNIFETGSVRGNYADVTLIPGDAGQLTYGRSQTTLASGNLFLLIKDYAARDDGAYCGALRSYLPRIEACDSSLCHDAAFRGLLADAGDDPVMRDVQDAFFDRVYWDPAMRSADAIGAKFPLSAAVVYDSTVHGSWALMRDRTRTRYGELARLGERTWMTDYIMVRRNWLATNPNAVLHKTVYRMDALAALIRSGNWRLRLPFTVRGETISEATLAAPAPLRAPAEAGAKRILHLTAPPMSGPDIAWLQERLARSGIAVKETGIFDAETEAGVRAFQKSHKLHTDGMVGPDTRAALEDLSVTKPAPTPQANAPMPSVARSAPLAAPLPAPLSPAPGGAGDALTELKQHVTAEAQGVVAQVRQIVQDEQEKLANEIAGLGRAVVTRSPTPARNVPSSEALAPVLTNARSLFAAAVGALVFGISQLKEALDWSVGLAPKTPPHGASLPTHGAPQATTIASETKRLGMALHEFMASLPPEWASRIRMAGFLLLCYVLYLLVARYFNIQKVKREIAEGAQVEKELSSLAKPG